MDRRSLLLAATTLLAGCGEIPSPTTETSAPTEPATDSRTTPTPTSSPTSTPTQTSTETPTDTETATETRTSTQTETETPDLTDREERALRLINRAVRELNQAVFIYAKADGGSLLDISASTETFRRVSIVQELSDAQDEISDAERLVSSRQQPTFNQVVTAHRFLSYCTDAQSHVIDAYSQAANGRNGVENESEGAIESAVMELQNITEDGNNLLTRIRDRTTAEEVSIVPAIPAEDYTAKVAQFEAELSGFEALSGFFESMREAIGELNDAQRFDRVDRERSARESAQRAVEDFERLSGEIQTFLDNLSESGASLRELTNSLLEISESKRELASEILEQNS